MIHQAAVLRCIKAALVSLALAGAVLSIPLSASASEVVHTFTSTIDVATDGSFTVQEEIVYDFGNANRHGIYRTLPTAHPQESSHWYTTRVINIDDVSVLQDGESVPISVTTAAGGKTIRIGDSDLTIQGEHTYTINYKVSGGLFYYDTEAPELYWNVTGSEWKVPIEEVTAIIKAPHSLIGEARTCYAGVPGTGGADSDTCGTTVSPEGAVFVTEGLNPGEELTIAQSLDPALLVVNKEERLLVLPFALGALVTFLIGLAIWIYRWRVTYRPANRTVIAQYEPYEDMLPMYTGLVADGRLDTGDITAGIVYLASEGFLKIRKVDRKVLIFTTDDYEIELTRTKDEAPTNFHRKLLDLLFSANEVGTVVAMKDLKADKYKQELNSLVLRELRRALKEDLQDKEFFAKSEHIGRHILVVLLIVTGGSLFFYLLHWYNYGHSSDVNAFWLLVSGVVALFSIGAIVTLAGRRRTGKGYAALLHTRGFKDFLAVTDKTRFDFHNAPEKSPETFMAYLPYAIALGVEDKWAEVFKDITIPQPDWYEEQGVRSFAAADFTSHISAFASDLAASATAPNSSSASGGGGFSGGGAGGGGGGSW